MSKEATFVFTAHLKKVPVTVAIQSSYHASVLHERYTHDYIMDEIKKYVNSRSFAFAKHKADTSKRIRAIDAIRGLLARNVEGKLLNLYIDILKVRSHIEALAPQINSPMYQHYVLTIQNIIDNAEEIVKIRAPYCIPKY